MRSTAYGYDALEIQEGSKDTYSCKRVDWGEAIWYRSYRWYRRALIWCTWFFIVLGAINVIAIAGLFILMMVKFYNTTYPDFDFYKNSRFAECAASIPTIPVNCSTMADIAAGFDNPGQYYIWGSKLTISPNWTTESTSYEWCDVMSCFSDFKVIPSSVNRRAMGGTLFGGWWFTSFSALSALWAFKGICPYFDSDESEKPCRGIRDLGFLDWVFTIWDICGPTLWWWISFGLTVARHDPRPSLSTLAWTVSWKYSYLVEYHPYRCLLARSPGIRRALPWILRVLTILQWGATFYLVYTIRATTFVNDRYTCLTDNTSAWPGTSTCTAEQLCSKSWLFGNSDFRTLGYQPTTMPIALFATSTLMVLLYPLELLVAKTFNLFSPGTMSAKSIKLFKHFFSPMSGLALWAVVTVGFATYTGVASVGTKFSAVHRDAPIAIDYLCTAVNVGVSPWRYYLDISEYERALRIVMLWFGV
ncbi:hypothetical protein BDW74DRAFT_154311 [Aspergillus multicolor]|uniref:uncharacterized protein n=1 Tax=Aspergillus multicolor TaxID=41759 RepID=UPI003CCE4F40